MDHRRPAGIAQQHLVDAVRRRGALVGRGHVQVKRGAHPRQLGAELAHDLDGAPLGFSGGHVFMAAHVLQFKTDLVQQRVQCGADGVPDVEVFDFLAQVDRTQAHREQGATEILDDLAQAFLRRELAQARVFAQAAARAAPGDARVAQAGHDAVQVPVGRRQVGGAAHCHCSGKAPRCPAYGWNSNMEVPH
ncbi:hypothetical protein G6F31_015138 [Rhizopus arrhizus]|nr:hypothetical protein G6F31_015138 [Rhizopus arrhizus]